MAEETTTVRPGGEMGARDAGLDAVRAVACAMVVVCHLSEYQGDGSLVWLKNGVLLFFALSGYLLYRPFVKGRVNLGRYALHRLARILPAYLVALIGLSMLTGDQTFRERPLTYLLFLQNFDRTLWQAFAGVTWTLALEVAFYVTLPLFAWAINRSLVRLIVLGLVSWLGAEVAYSAFPPAIGLWASSWYPFMIWTFVPGMAVALLEDRLSRSYAPLILGVVLLATASVTGPWASIDLPSGVGSGLVIAWAAGSRPSLGRLRPLASAGAALTYSMYLWHVDLIKHLPNGAIAMGMVVVVAAAIYLIVERPVLRWAKAQAILLNQSMSMTESEPPIVPSGESSIPTRSTVPAHTSAVDSGAQTQL